VDTEKRNYVAVFGRLEGGAGLGARAEMSLVVDITDDDLPIEPRIMTASAWDIGGIETLLDVDGDGYLDLARVFYIDDFAKPLSLKFFSGRTGQPITVGAAPSYRLKSEDRAAGRWCLLAR